MLIDRLVQREGLGWFRARRAPEQAVMTIRHHLRDGERFRAEFGCELRCHEAGLHEHAGGPSVRGCRFGEQLAPAEGSFYEGDKSADCYSFCPQIPLVTPA